MLEILNIFYFFAIFILLFSFPFNKILVDKIIKTKNHNFNFFDFQSLNIIFFCYLMLIISFFNLNLKIVYYFYLLVALIYAFKFNFKKLNLKKIKDKKYFFFFSLITVSIFFYVAHNLKLEWDGHHWLEKVVFFYDENKIENFYKLKIHPEYPHLGSYIWALFWKNSFINFEYVGRLFCIYFYSITVFSFANILDNKLEKFKIFLIIFLIIITFEPYLLGGYQDYFLFSILILSSRLIIFLDFKKINHNLLIIIILTLGLMMWFKDEGLIYYTLFSLLLLLNIDIKTNLKFFYLFLVFFIILINFIIVKYLLGLYELPSGTASSLTLEITEMINNYKLIVTRSLDVILQLLIDSIKYPAWIIIFCSIFFLFYKRLIKDKIKFFIQCLILNILFLYTSFITFGSGDYMLSVAFDRLLFQTSGFYLNLGLMVLNFKKKQI